MHRILQLARFFLADPWIFLRYVTVGGSAAALEFSLFTVLHLGLSWPLLVANNVALGVSIGYCFLMQRRWTFRAHDGSALRQLRWYLIMQAFSALLNNLLMWILVVGLGWYAPLAKVVEIGLVFLWNFGFCRLVVFRDAGKPLSQG